MNKPIGILTSSRADFGIYLPLLKKLKLQSDFGFKLIVFGTHLSKDHGHTVDEIIAEGFTPDYSIYQAQTTNDAHGIAENFAAYSKTFAEFWQKNKNDFSIILTLGDRYEMASAVLSTVPFGLKVAHIHAGETTLGAIDNIYRHCITLAASVCFTSTEQYNKRVRQLNPLCNAYTVGSLSLDGLNTSDLPSREDLSQRFHIDFSKPVIMVVFHPETVHPENNVIFIREIIEVIDSNPHLNFVINYPNMDTGADSIRQALSSYRDKIGNIKRVVFVEHFGKQYYFSCLLHSSLLIGNSSSGIIEAASFGKYVINLGKRQEGRAQSSNTVDCDIVSSKISQKMAALLAKGPYNGKNIYLPANSPSEMIIKILKNETMAQDITVLYY